MTMNTKREHDHDDYHDHDDRRTHDNDNGRAVAPAPSGGALASLTALEAALNAVDIASVAGRSGLPMLRFKRDGNGTWTFGQKGTVVEDGSSWAVNPRTFKRGFICFSNDNKVVGESLLPVSQPMPDVTELPDKGFEWQQQWAVNLKCIDGTDAGTEVIYKPTTVGGIQAIAGLIEAVRDRLNGGQHNSKIAPIVQLEKDSYQHGQFGRVWTPLMPVVDWMSPDGPAPAPAPAPASPPSTEQPRRRRVA
jgi:hypothetical protein